MLGYPFLLDLVLFALGLYGAYCLLLSLAQRRLLYPRIQPGNRPALRLAHADAEVVWLDTGWGRVESWYFGPATELGRPAPAVIIAHGNAEFIDTFPAEFLRFRDLGMAVYLVEYPGYGRSEGSPSQRTLSEIFVAAYDALVARDEIDTDGIVLFGRSLGGAAVCALAEERAAAALILVSCFESLGAMAHRFLVPAFLLRDRFDNLAVVRSFPGPVLVIHGAADRLIPYSQGRRLYQAAQRGTPVTYECGHECPRDWNRFWCDVTEFLRRSRIID